jgi:glyoxylase-like metal-dependent hydrolase (beta-lactamase superfamily II)
MKPATSLQEITTGLFGWAGYHEQWKVDFNSYALRTDEGVFLIDPTRPEPAVMEKIKHLGEVIGILLTNENHSRDADWFRKHFEAQVYAHEKAKGDCEIKLDVLLMDNETLPGGIRVIHMPGACSSEVAFYTPKSKGIVLLGDTLLNNDGEGLSYLPDPYLDDKKAAKKSAQNLLKLKFQTLTFAHGKPLTGNAREQLAKFLTGRARKPKKKKANS